MTMTQTKVIYLRNFSSFVPQPHLQQSDIVEYAKRMFASAQCVLKKPKTQSEAQEIYAHVTSQFDKYALAPEYISKRQFMIFPQDIKERLSDKKSVPKSELLSDIVKYPNGDILQNRMKFYAEKVLDVVRELYRDISQAPDDIIHVTCAGYLSPSPVQSFINEKGWLDSAVTHSYHMGCYGAFPPVRMAAGFLSHSDTLLEKKKRADIIHTELLSTHFDASKLDAGNIVNMTLFADGYIKYSAFLGEKNDIPSESLAILSMADAVIPDSLEDMSWIPGQYQFDMFLSKNVPIKIRDIVQSFIEKLCQKAAIDFEKEKNSMIFAIHPGGPKILDYVKEELELREDQVAHAREIFYENGNMSSATIPHIWKSICEDTSIPSQTKIVTMAFGPGLTATGFILEKC